MKMRGILSHFNVPYRTSQSKHGFLHAIQDLEERLSEADRRYTHEFLRTGAFSSEAREEQTHRQLRRSQANAKDFMIIFSMATPTSLKQESNGYATVGLINSLESGLTRLILIRDRLILKRPNLDQKLQLGSYLPDVLSKSPQTIQMKRTRKVFFCPVASNDNVERH